MLILIALLVIALCASVVGVGLYLSRPSHAVIGNPPANLPGAQNVEIQSASGALLRGWWVPADHAGGGGIVLMHGAWDNRQSMVRRAEALHKDGFSVLLFDFQGHGESTGKHITYGKLEALDAAAAVDFIRKKLPGERIGAIGVSLGGAANLLGPQPLNVDALVIESVYLDINSALTNRLRKELGPYLGPVFTPLLVPMFQLLLPPILGVRPDELRPVDHIAQVRAPLLVISGTNDNRIPSAEAHALYNNAPDPKQFWMVQGAGHEDLEKYNSQQYWSVVLPFLIQNLRHID